MKAAERCHVSQPSLSVQISKLEARLGTVLFERTTRRLMVTSQGRLLIDQMRRILLEAGNLLAHLQGKMSGTRVTMETGFQSVE